MRWNFTKFAARYPLVKPDRLTKKSPDIPVPNWSKTMTKFALTLAALTSVAALQAQAETAPAAAADASAIVVADVDGNGSFSLVELKAAYPDVTEAAYKAADIDADGELSAEELKAAQDAKAFDPQ